MVKPRQPDDAPRNTKAIGVASEAIVFARLVELEYAVSLPFGDNERYDLVVDDGEKLSRVQVKTGRLRRGSVIFNTANRNVRTNQVRSYAGEADDFLVYCPDTNEIYKVPVADCHASRQVSLRVDAQPHPNGRPSLRWAHEHVFADNARLLRLDPLGACATVHPDTPPRMAQTGNRRYCKECNLTYCRRSRARQAASQSEKRTCLATPVAE